MKNHPNKRPGLGRVFLILGFLLLSSSVLLIAYNIRESRRAGYAAEARVRELHRQMAAPAREEASPPPGGTALEDTAAPQAAAPVPSLEIDGEHYLGILSIPSLVLELPIQSDWSESRLKQAPCRYSGGAESGDLVVAGHNYKAHFGRLGELSPGDRVLLTAAGGREYAYSVESLERLSPWQTEEMVAGDWDLTLFTCTSSGRARLAVRCVRTEQHRIAYRSPAISHR